jgi:hypothetical protein
VRVILEAIAGREGALGSYSIFVRFFHACYAYRKIELMLIVQEQTFNPTSTVS